MVKNMKKLEEEIEKFNNNLCDVLNDELALEKKRISFVNDFSIDRINNMRINDFYEKGNKNTFFYRIEYELKELGEIRSKQGITISGLKKINGIYTANSKEFNDIKRNIIDLLNAAKRDNKEDIEANKINAIFKYKIINTYYPNEYLNVYSEKDLNEIINKLGIGYEKKISFLDKQNIINEWRNANNKTKEWSNYVLMVFLYTNILKKNSKRNNRIMQKERDEYDKKYRNSINEIINQTNLSKYKNTIYVDTPNKKPVLIKKNGIKVCYKRDVVVALEAIKRAGYKCECCCGRKLFKRKIDGTNYVEAHHLIPMKAQVRFKCISIDIPENVVSLCSSCHKEIHYGKNRDRIIEKLYKDRKDGLSKRGLKIKLEELIKYYD